jgi:predicted ATPase
MPAPAPASSFVGRAGELGDLAALLARERLVTVVGPGGCGKTRLAIEALTGRLVGLDPADAVALFYDRARRIQPRLADADAVADEICALADGLPLAVELAAAHARALPLVDIRDGMADRMRFLVMVNDIARGRGASCATSRPYWSSGAGGWSCSTARSARTSWT